MLLTLDTQELKMCYQCANRDTKAETGAECEQSSAYSVTQIFDPAGNIADYECTNQVDSCRWRICQCDRAFAHKIKQKVKIGVTFKENVLPRSNSDMLDTSRICVRKANIIRNVSHKPFRKGIIIK